MGPAVVPPEEPTAGHVSMSNESESDADGEPVDEEPIDDARIDAFLDRLEDAEPVDEESDATIDWNDTANSGDDTSETTDAPGSGASETTDAPGSDAAVDRSAIEPDASDPRSTTDDADPGDRLWDSFGSASGSDADAKPTGADGTPSTTSTAGEPTAADSTEPAAASSDRSTDDAPEPASAEPTGTEDTDAAASATEFEFGVEPAADDGGNEDDETVDGGGSSFSGVLDRISHRVTGGGTTDTDRSGDTSDDEWTAGRGDSSGSAGSTGRSTQADTIDQILNNIDAFGRATASSQVLLLSPTAHSITNEIYRRFLMPDDGSGQNILFVSATGTVDDQLATAEEIPAWTGGKTAVIEVGRSGLKPTEPGAGPDPTRRLDIHKGISNLNHLAKLGVNISHIVSQWDGDSRPTVVGVHTLSAIQQYVGNETMFQFLFTLKGQLNSRGVMGFYHMDPRAHTDTELDTITSAFDIVIRIGSDGSVDIE